MVFSFQLVAADNSTSDTQSQGADSQPGDVPPERVAGIGDSRPPSFQSVVLDLILLEYVIKHVSLQYNVRFLPILPHFYI